jgi:outer membrane protein
MKKTLLLTAGLLCSTPLMAGDLLSVYQLAKKNDPTLSAAEQSRFAVGEIKPQSRALLLPNLSVAGDTTDNSVNTDSNFAFNPSRDEDFNTNGYTVTLVQPVFDYDLWVGLSQADSTDKRAAADYITAEQDLIIRLATRYFSVLGAQDNLEFSNAEKDANARQLEQAKQRFEVGLIAITDVHEAQARYDITVADVIEAENLLANWKRSLVFMMKNSIPSGRRSRCCHRSPPTRKTG